MTAGLPGVGIGGIFYILCALLMPFKELFSTIRRRSSVKRWKLVASQLFFVCGILGGFWVTGLLLGLTFKKLVCQTTGLSGAAIPNVFRMQPFMLSLIVLASVYFVLKIINYFLDKKHSSLKFPDKIMK